MQKILVKIIINEEIFRAILYAPNIPEKIVYIPVCYNFRRFVVVNVITYMMSNPEEKVDTVICVTPEEQEFELIKNLFNDLKNDSNFVQN